MEAKASSSLCGPATGEKRETVALKAGMAKCSYDIIARMDAGDINMPTRFQKQVQFLEKNPDIDVVSLWVGAFEKGHEKILFVRGGAYYP